MALVLLLSVSSGIFPGTGMSTARRAEPADLVPAPVEEAVAVEGFTALAFALAFKTVLTNKVLEMLAAERAKGRTDVPSDDEMSACYVVHNFASEADVARLEEVVAGGKKTIIGAVSDVALLQNPVFIEAMKKLELNQGIFNLIVPSCSAWIEAVRATMDERGVSPLVEAFKAYDKSITVLEKDGDEFGAAVEAMAASSTEIDAPFAPIFKAYDFSAGVYQFTLLRHTEKSIAVKNSFFCKATAWKSDFALPDYAEDGVERLEACANMAVDLLFRQDAGMGEDITTYALLQRLKKRYPDKNVVVVGYTNPREDSVPLAPASIFVTAQSNVARFATYLQGASASRYMDSVLVVRGSTEGFCAIRSISTLHKNLSGSYFSNSLDGCPWQDLFKAVDAHFGITAA